MAKSLVIMLHGVGSNGDDLAGLGSHWSPALPGTAFASPDAPYPFPHGAGYQWFSLDGITEQNRPARVVAAREAFDQLLHDILDAHQMSGQLDRVVLVGFSQGSIMALDALVSGRWPVAGVVAFSGRLSSPQPFTPATHTPALLIHGHADAVIPWAESEAAALRLIAAGVEVKTQFEPATGHTISGQGASTAATFIAGCLA
ncbi:dienelactone hydrolase family protein [Erwiniaceae bacterium BAC15a-03b]|uniref:Dienelactone hydrolase family protein n=1 Tax=Winslowiella arboricola TaxID=2978220 RepID=A0A9J6PK06_9GAMM|nr:dienelactone hydrolase family protein [Winslowiella arboricola]MCU5773796.1 dienelactone hydrolase family protein [Winslowiella arboricola]MCU5777706.1 dienelactone hydrolase family protein [Winslowiella arboricola]